MKRIRPIMLILALGLALTGCDGSAGSPPATSSQQSPETLGNAEVSGTYTSGGWVIRLAPDGTWEEDLNGRVNAYGGAYTLDGNTITLNDRRGSSETATISGTELRLPSITLQKQAP